MLTKIELEVLQELVLRPSGAMIRTDPHRAAVLDLAERQLVCDPHEMGSSLFTRITDEGKAALATGEPLAGF